MLTSCYQTRIAFAGGPCRNAFMASSQNTAIRLDGLGRRFIEGQREHVVLDGVSLELERGQSLAVRGRSGSGKSTLLNLIGGIDTPDSGTVLVNGIELTRLNERERTLFRRRHIGFVYQAFNLVPTLNVGDNVRLVLELNGIVRQDARKRVDELLESVGLADRAESYPDLLSGGEQQRVAIARALSHRPAVLIADEPTGNLDDATAGKIIDLLDRLVRVEGSTMIMATHSARVAATCDRVIELHDGRLVESA